MRLVAYESNRGPRVAGVRDGGYVDLNRASPDVPSCIKELLAQGPQGLISAQAALEAGEVMAADAVNLLPPIPSPEKVICVGVNYADHARESGMKPPAEPVIFSKFPSAVIADGHPIVLPRLSETVDYEAELVVVIGIGGRAADVPLPIGFGALIGPDAGLHALGILFESQYAAGRAPAGHHLAKGIYGGAADPSVMKRTDDELVALMIEETSRVIGIPVQPTWTRVVRQTPGIPQYEVGHVAWMREIDERLVAHPGLHLAGWGYRGIGVSGLGIDAVRLADAITDEGG